MSHVESNPTFDSETVAIESIANLVSTLQEKLPSPVQCWQLDQQWRPIESSDSPSVNADVPGIKDSLVRAESCVEPYSVVTSGKNSHLLVVPYKSGSNKLLAAVSRIQTGEPEVFVRLAQFALETTGLKRQLDDLLTENNGFVRQVTEDFEELCFLRQVAKDLEVSNHLDDCETLSRKMFELVNRSINAESISLVPAPPRMKALKATELDFTTLGDLPCSTWTLQQLCQQHHDGPTTIVNHFSAGNTGEDIKNIHSFIICPLVKSETVLGWIIALNRTWQQTDVEADRTWREFNPEFGSSEATLLNATAAMLATHISNTDLFRRNKRLLASVVRVLVCAIEAKDTYTCGHSERVALYGQCLARQIGYSTEDLERLYLSGILHDIGKIGIPDAVLAKPGQLTDEEFEEIKQHPRKGWTILRGLDEMEAIMPGVLFHHERFDGKGYPVGLVGEDIPLDGRLLAVVDAFDAMTSDRPYRKGMPIEKAVSILLNGAGTQWDADLVKAFVKSVDEIKVIHDSPRPAFDEDSRAIPEND